MRDILLSIVLGIVEGITEFLPISSTAHIRLVQGLFDLPLDDPFWKMYAIVIQLGAILSVLVYFRKRIIEFVKTFPRGRNGDRTPITHPLSLAVLACVATIIPAYLADKMIGKNLESLKIMGWALLIGGVVMWVIDALCTRIRVDDIERMSLPQAIFIGAAQVLAAAFPGTSRSMVTIAAGQVTGMSRAAALEFSFFLSIPTMFAATGYKLLSTLLKGEVVLTGHYWIVLIVGFVVSFLVAWAVIAWFMHWVRRRGFVPFAVYRIILGLAVLLMVWFGRVAV